MFVLVTGSNGQLGSSLNHLVDQNKTDYRFVFATRQQLDLTDFENIRSFRQHFEQGTIPMRFALGDNQHQTLIVAMYEGTEKLLNQDVSEFAVLEYLEGLKLTAKELRQQGISGEQFRTSLLEHSASTVRDLVSSS